MLDGISASLAYTLIARDRGTWEARFAARKDTARDVDQFLTRAARFTDAEDLLKDYKALTFVLTAFGMEGEIGKTAVLRKLMTEDPTASDSFANRMVDPRFRAFADAMAELLPSPAVRTRMAGTIGDGYRLLNPTAPETEVKDFKARLAAVGTAGALLADRALADATLAAFGLAPSGVTDGQLRLLLTEDPDAPDSFAAGQTNTAFGDYARAMARVVVNPGVFDRILNGAPGGGLVDRWTTNAFEIAQETSGVRAALYFRRMIGGVGSVNELMSDKVLMEVVRGALGFGDAFAAIPFEQQQRVLAQRIDFADFRDPKAVDRMAQRYLTGKQDTGASSPLLALFDNSGSTNGILALGVTLNRRA